MIGHNHVVKQRRITFLVIFGGFVLGGCESASGQSIEIRCAEQSYRTAKEARGVPTETIPAVAATLMWLRRAEGIAPNERGAITPSQQEMEALHRMGRSSEPPIRCELSEAERGMAAELTRLMVEAAQRNGNTYARADVTLDVMSRLTGR